MTGNRSVHDDEDEDKASLSGPQHARVVTSTTTTNNHTSSNESVGTTMATLGEGDDDVSTLVVTPTNSVSTSTNNNQQGSSSLGAALEPVTATMSAPAAAAAAASASADSSCVQVAVRVRPLLSHTLESGCGSCIRILPSHLDYSTTIQIGSDVGGPKFTFDEVFPTTTTQLEVFEHKVAPLVERCLEGYNATILAYGQTGSGKTHTVIGPSTCHATPEDESSGMIPRAVTSLFDQLRSRKKLEMEKQQQQQQQQQQQSSSSSPSKSPSPNKRRNNNKNKDSNNLSFEFQVRVQFLELYGEEIRDLLATSSSSEKLTIRDIGNDEPEVVGATFQVVASAEESLRCLTKGMLRRVTAATAMNESSSRSHAIFSILVDQTWPDDTSSAAAATGPQARRSKFNFVDLAGSERQKRTRAEGRRLKEGIDINKGLLVLGNVISALGDPKKRGKAFVPYRDSKLTRLLKGSLGGNHKTLMIACVSPSSTNMEESLNCLRYANRAKNIQNRAVVNLDARSRMIVELKTQVQALAKDLLTIKETGDPGRGAFTREALATLVAGGSNNAGGAANNNSSSTTAVAMSPAKKQSAPVTPATGKASSVTSSTTTTTTTTATPSRSHFSSPGSTGIADNGLQQRLTDTEEELEHTRNQLKRCRRENLITEERLHVTQAEKEFYRLQLEAVGDSENVGGENGDHNNTSSNKPPKLQIDQLFLNRATAYEKEIGKLKEELRTLRGQVVVDLGRGGGGDSMMDTVGNPNFSIEKANQTMQEERERLATIQTELLSLGGGTPKLGGGSPFKSSSTPTRPPRTPTTTAAGAAENNDGSADVDSEAKAEEDHVTALTLKYSYMEDEDEVMIVDGQNTPRVTANNVLSQSERSTEHRRAQIEADLLEISRVIESKEELISQLQCSQAKYSSMKEFYEGKLHEMEQLLDQKEEERQKIIVEMERLKENNHDTKELEEQLRKKEEHIAGIRKQKLQLKDLTAVSSRNATEIKKLQNDVRAMKEKKVQMQKQLSEERKSHAMEIRMLKKEVLQKDRETRKWQKTANQKASEAEKANQVAKMKVHQLGQLRAKYKDAEKTIRMLQIKKGVMAKAGLDSVIVGRRGATAKKVQSRNPSSESRSVDADSLRDYFDRKVAEVGRKEALADKLARGWEEHMQLTLQRAELEEQDAESSKEEIQALDLRIQYEEDRIRKLAHRLGKKQPSEAGGDGGKPGGPNSILYGKDFEKICNGASPTKSAEIAAKVLFGMVVRERRRIASLAKTASSLDEKLQECQMDNEAKEVAFRSYVQDSQQDFANISMNHQEQILSLMSLVKGGGSNPDATNSVSDTTTVPTDAESIATDMTESSKLLVLANERVAVLEQQVRDLKTENRVSESYRLEKEETKKELAAKTDEYEKLEIRLAGLRATLRRVRDQITDAKNNDNKLNVDLTQVFGSCLGIIREALLESPGPMSPRARARRHSCPPTNVFHPTSFSPQSQKQWEFMQLAADDEDEEEEETPDWADEIMADLALIAEGQLPPSLQGIPDMPDFEIEKAIPDFEPSTVIPEVPDIFMPEILVSDSGDGWKSAAEQVQAKSPPRLTGIPKPKVTNSASPKNRPSNSRLESKPAEDGGSEDSLALNNDGVPESKRDSPTKLMHANPLVEEDEIPPSSSLKSEGSAVTKGSKDSVFDRLGNPSHFTGAEREKYYAQAGARQEHQDSAADRMLDHLLESNADLFSSRSGGSGGGGGDEVNFTRRSSDSSSSANKAAGAVATEVTSKVKEYTRQNVFERLQKTTTQSFAGKHPPHHHETTAMADAHSSQGSTDHHHKTDPAKRSSLEGRAKRAAVAAASEQNHHSTDVHSKTAMNMHKSPTRPTKFNKPKTNVNRNRSVDNNRSPQKPGNSRRSMSPSRMKSPARQRTANYTQQDVFERLTKTTTEAYAVKKRVVKN